MFKIALIGRVNVGKSTLFNRLIEEKKSIISSIPGTTRDRIYGQCLWRGKMFELIDLGGIKKKISPEENLEEEIQKQIEIALEEADLILFLIDIKESVKKEDWQIAQKIKKFKKEVILVLNKADSLKLRELGEDSIFLKFGFGQPVLVSAVNGSGLGDLLDEIIKKIEETKISKMGAILHDRAKQYPLQKPITVAIVGKTNVGKSTLINSLLNEERVIVSPQPHTTREPIDTFLAYKDQKFILIDTAGIRKKTKIKSEIEKVGVEKSLKMIKRSEIVFLIFDLSQKISALDRRLVGLIKQKRRGFILVVNKLDLAELPIEKYINYYQKALPSFWWAPIVFTSAKEKKNLEKLLDLAIEIKEKMKQIFGQNELDKILKDIIREYDFKEKFWLKTNLKQQLKPVPIFLLELPKLTRKEKPPNEAQINIVEKKIRQTFDLWGIPIEIEILNSKS